LLAEGNSAKSRLIGGTKGSHVVVSSFPGAPRETLYVEAQAHHRPYFIVPWNGLYLIGTTDQRYTGNPDQAQATEREIEYLIGETNRVIPLAQLGREAVLYSYAGVRPLAYHPVGAESSITRRHIVHDHAPDLTGLISIVGGKLTTYRNLAAQAVDLACRKLKRREAGSLTARLPLPGADTPDFGSFAAKFIRESGLPSHVAAHLVDVYGTRADEVLACAGGESALLQPLARSTAIAAEVIFAFRHEMARTLTDVLLRRSMAGLGAEMGIGTDQAAAHVAVQQLGFDGTWAERQVVEYREALKRFRPR
jgi:glycerol-3-phosphate dehydrogenase